LTYPFEIHIGNLSVPLHTVLETLGIFIGFRLFIYLRKKQGDVIESPNRIWILIGATFGALAGSRLVGAFENPIAWFQSDHPLLYFYQNKTVVGGFLGGLLGVELIKKWIGEKSASGDLFVFPMLLALIIGRVGCFSMGVHEETYGVVTSFPLAMDLGDGLMRHPVTLYEILFLMVLGGALYYIQRNMPLENGALFKLFMIAYISFRFLLDFIKPHYTFSIGVSTIQLVCLMGLLYYLPYIIQPKKLLAAYA
jgi:phosphatidylglycerol---prolipoprotein diacylglyceryl transferase